MHKMIHPEGAPLPVQILSSFFVEYEWMGKLLLKKLTIANLLKPVHGQLLISTNNAS